MYFRAAWSLLASPDKIEEQFLDHRAPSNLRLASDRRSSTDSIRHATNSQRDSVRYKLVVAPSNGVTSDPTWATLSDLECAELAGGSRAVSTAVAYRLFEGHGQPTCQPQ
jgi:hypothetical protein